MPQNRFPYSLHQFKQEMEPLMKRLNNCKDLDAARTELFHWVNYRQREAFSKPDSKWNRNLNIIRDCARALRSLCSRHGEQTSGTSLVQTLFDIAQGRPSVIPHLRTGA